MSVPTSYYKIKMFAINNKILEVNLTTGESNSIKLDNKIYEKFLGGTGIAAKIFFDRGIYKFDALSDENILIFMAGPVTGTGLPGASRFEVCTKSPLTNIWGEASCGGRFGHELKCTGYDGIIITGRCATPSYLVITDDKVELRTAVALWEKDTYYTEDKLKEELGKKYQIVTIGQAGENKVKYAAILTDKGDAAARCGVGCVMGNKQLKAIAIHGSKKLTLRDEEGFNNLRKKLINKLKLDPLARALNQYGTNSSMPLGCQIGDVPTKNWRIPVWPEGCEKIDGVAITEKILKSKKACLGCPVACKRIVKTDKFDNLPGPEYESAASLGSLLLNADLDTLVEANILCNKYGMDTISTGACIAFAIECYENGILSKKDTAGLELKWGDRETILGLIEKIANRDGIGDILAEGVREAAKKLKKGADKFALHIKGQEVPMHDPRCYHGLALSYATSNRGACHTQDMNLMIEMNISRYPEIGIRGDYKVHSSEDRAEYTVISQNFGMIYSSAVLCYFIAAMLSFDDILNMINVTTDLDLTDKELLKIGERIWYLKRSILNLCGIRREDDTLPSRILEPYLEGTTLGLEKILIKLSGMKPPRLPLLRKVALNLIYNTIFPKLKKGRKLLHNLSFFSRKKMEKNPFLVVPNLKVMLDEYYKLREYTKDGLPKEDKLKELGLEEVAEELRNIN